MTFRSKSLITIISLVSLFTACKKNTPSNNNSNNSNNTSTADCKACSYEPVCYNSTYTYIDSTYSGVAQRSFSFTGLSDTTIQGVVYQKVITSGGNINSYYNCNNGVTTTLALNVVLGIGLNYGTYPVVKITPLKANGSVGTTWTDVISTPGQPPVTYVSTIVEKGITRNVLGVNFTGVIHVNVSDSIAEDSDPPYFNDCFGSGDYYFASGTGLIENIFTDQYGNEYQHSVLKSYSIPN